MRLRVRAASRSLDSLSGSFGQRVLHAGGSASPGWSPPGWCFGRRARAQRRGRGEQRGQAESCNEVCSDIVREVCNHSRSVPTDEFPFKRRLAAPRSHSPLAAPLAARRFPLAATRVPTRAFHVPTGNTSGATGNSCGDSRFRLGARGGNSPGRLGHQGSASLAQLGPSPLARRPRRARLAPATCVRRVRLALAPLPRAPPLPPRSLPMWYVGRHYASSHGVRVDRSPSVRRPLTGGLAQ